MWVTPNDPMQPLVMCKEWGGMSLATTHTHPPHHTHDWVPSFLYLPFTTKPHSGKWHEQRRCLRNPIMALTRWKQLLGTGLCHLAYNTHISTIMLIGTLRANHSLHYSRCYEIPSPWSVWHISAINSELFASTDTAHTATQQLPPSHTFHTLLNLLIQWDSLRKDKYLWEATNHVCLTYDNSSYETVRSTIILVPLDSNMSTVITLTSIVASFILFHTHA